MSRLVTSLALALVLWQAVVGLCFLAERATSASLHDRGLALTASEEERIELELGETAPLWSALTSALAQAPAGPTVVYLFPSEGLPTDLGELKRWQRRIGTPLTALLQPVVVRLMLPDLSPGPLVGDETLYLVEVGPPSSRPFLGALEELAGGEGFRIFRLPAGATR